MKKNIVFLSFLLLYIIIIAIAHKDGLWADERRYIEYAVNLSQGDYLPNYEDFMWNGPGYPVFLATLVLLKVPFIFMKFANAVFLLLAVYFFYLTLRLYISDRNSLFFTFLFGIYPPFLRYIHFILTEVFSVFLVCCFLYYFCRLFCEEKHKLKNLAVSSGILGYFAMTKIFFGYVILTLLLLSLTLYVFRRTDALKKIVLVYLCSLVFCVPYLVYSYSVTGKIFYWGNSGGSSLYWMSTPYENELGDWHGSKHMRNNTQLFENHRETFSNFETLSYTEMDEALKRKAVRNIMENPSKFIRNWLANIGRLLFNYPFSYTNQKLSTYFYIIPNMFLVVFFVVSLYPAFMGRRMIPHEVYGLLLFGLVSFGGCSLLSAYNRHFWPLVPVFFFWISFVMNRIVNIEVKR